MHPEFQTGTLGRIQEGNGKPHTTLFVQETFLIVSRLLGWFTFIKDPSGLWGAHLTRQSVIIQSNAVRLSGILFLVLLCVLSGISSS